MCVSTCTRSVARRVRVGVLSRAGRARGVRRCASRRAQGARSRRAGTTARARARARLAAVVVVAVRVCAHLRELVRLALHRVQLVTALEQSEAPDAERVHGASGAYVVQPAEVERVLVEIDVRLVCRLVFLQQRRQVDARPHDHHASPHLKHVRRARRRALGRKVEGLVVRHGRGRLVGRAPRTRRELHVALAHRDRLLQHRTDLRHLGRVPVVHRVRAMVPWLGRRWRAGGRAVALRARAAANRRRRQRRLPRARRLARRHRHGGRQLEVTRAREVVRRALARGRD